MPKVRFEPIGVEVEVPEGTSLMAAADQAAREVDEEFFIGECCEGRLECGNCCLEILEGTGNLSPVTPDEADLPVAMFLALQVLVLGEIRVGRCCTHRIGHTGDVGRGGTDGLTQHCDQRELQQTDACTSHVCWPLSEFEQRHQWHLTMQDCTAGERGFRETHLCVPRKVVLQQSNHASQTTSHHQR